MTPPIQDISIAKHATLLCVSSDLGLVNMNNISIVIRCLNEAKHLPRLFRGIRAQTVRNVELILVDSGSNDASVDIARQFGARILSIDPRSFSFGRSLNLGCKASRGEIIIAASAHVYPVTDTWLENLISPFNDPGVALTYGRQCGNEYSQYSERRLFQQWFPDVSTNDQTHPFCNNANAAIRRSVWEQLRYDESLTGLEDVDWAYRAKAYGWKISYVAEAAVVHVHNESFKQIINRHRRESIAYTKITGDQHLNLLRCAALVAASIFSDLRHARQSGVHRLPLKSILRFRLAQYLGAYLGNRQHGTVAAELRQRFYYPPEPAPKGGRPTLDLDGNPILYHEDVVQSHGTS